MSVQIQPDLERTIRSLGLYIPQSEWNIQGTNSGWILTLKWETDTSKSNSLQDASNYRVKTSPKSPRRYARDKSRFLDFIKRKKASKRATPSTESSMQSLPISISSTTTTHSLHTSETPSSDYSLCDSSIILSQEHQELSNVESHLIHESNSEPSLNFDNSASPKEHHSTISAMDLDNFFDYDTKNGTHSSNHTEVSDQLSVPSSETVVSKPNSHTHLDVIVECESHGSSHVGTSFNVRASSNSTISDIISQLYREHSFPSHVVNDIIAYFVDDVFNELVRIPNNINIEHLPSATDNEDVRRIILKW